MWIIAQLQIYEARINTAKGKIDKSMVISGKF